MATNVQDFLQQNPNYIGRANTANQTPAKPRARGGPFSAWISEAGAAVGGALGVPFGPAGIAFGAGLGGAGGRLLENKIRDDRIDTSSFKQAGVEGSLAAVLSGLAPAYKGIKGAYAARGAIQAAPTLVEGAQGAAKILKPSQFASKTAFTAYKNSIDDFIKAGAKGSSRNAIVSQLNKDMIKGGIAKPGVEKAATQAVEAGIPEAMSLSKAAKLTAGPNKLVRGGREAVRATLGIDDILAPGKTGPTSILKADDMLDEALKSGFKGSPKSIQRQIAVQYGRFNKEVAGELAKSTKTTSASQLFKNAQKEVAEKLPISIDGVPVKQELSRSLNQLKSLSKGGRITGSDVYKFKSGLEVDNAFRKISGELSSPLTAKETVDLALWKHADDLIGGNVGKGIKGLAPAAKELTQRQSKLYGLSKGIARMVRTPGEPGNIAQIAVRAGQRPFRAAENAIGRGMIQAGGVEAGAGNLVPQAARGFAGTTARQAVRQSPGNLFEAITSSPPPAEQDTTLYGANALQGGEIYGNQTPDLPNGTSGPLDPRTKQPIQQSAYPLEQALMDLKAHPDAKSQKNIMDYYDFVSSAETAQAKARGGGGPNITKVTAQNYGNALSGYQSLDQLKELLSSDPSAVTRSATPGRGLPIVGGFVSRGAGTGEFDAIGYNIADTLLRLRTGAQANPGEIKKLATQLMPRAGDNESTIQRKINTLENAFGTILQQANSGGGQDDLASALMQAQGTY